METGDKVKHIQGKNLSVDFLCLSQPPQSISGARSSVLFHFDEYHTLIQGEIYENRSWFYNRTCIGKFTLPLFQAKQSITQVWVDLEDHDEERTLDQSGGVDADEEVMSNGEAFVMSDDELAGRDDAKQTGIASPSRTPGQAPPTRPRVRYMMESNTEHNLDMAMYPPAEEDVLPVEEEDMFESLSQASDDDRRRVRTRTANAGKPHSAPTSPKRQRASSIKSSSTLGSSSNLYMASSSISPSSSTSCMTNAYGTISRPSSPPYSPPSAASPLDTTSPRVLDNYYGKRKSTDMKSSKEIAMESGAWFGFLSTSPPGAPESPLQQPPRPVKPKKRALITMLMHPVTCSIQDFEILGSISHGALNSPNQLFLVRDKDTDKPWLMKVVPTISHHDDGGSGAPVVWEGSKESVSYSTTLAYQMPPHPFLVDLLTTFQNDNKLYLIMEWFGGGELFSVLHRTRHGRFDEHEALFYTAQLVLGMEHIHQHKMIYRDLKPENLLLSPEGNLKITQRTPPETQWCGSRHFSIVCGHSLPEYLAPEILKGLPYSEKADSWSIGTILYHMLVGVAPFHHPNVQHLFAAIISDDVQFPPFLSADVVSLLKGLLHRDVKKRLSLKHIKSHEWFGGLDWGKLLRKEYTPPLRPFRRQDVRAAPARRRTPQALAAAPGPAQQAPQPVQAPPPLDLAALR